MRFDDSASASASGNSDRVLAYLKGFASAEGGASFDDFQQAEKKIQFSAPIFDITKRREGAESNSWKVVNWADPISTEDESMFNCELTTFVSSSGKQAGICVGSAAPIFDITKRREGAESNSWKVVNWEDPISTEDESMFDCEWESFVSSSGKQAAICATQISKCADGKYFADVWNKGEGGKAPYYHLEIGAQHGACILEMLLETDAMILAFEPHPKNVYSIRKTISALPKALQNRV
eukprot:CAMPEP_0202031590 /NCGR_PEP_ID=MMETSP0905-20130828/65097_1 /ASSEMBLY_ACC=CAM_ASM_000554 /TAXON_ID=420261 /ORGANISM="Thalassiosira antarctica, Strain CCMP982" /LENGTH=236 /DNA_ID=CAMNT_0048595437 /DNA_START=70 /DNA_END=775 /DNA_ORIENTATION=-